MTPKVILKMICKLNNEYKEELEKRDPKKFAARLRSLQKANGFLEPKTGWKNSRAREILWDLLHTGDIPLDGKKLTTKVILKKVCDMSDEHKEEMEKWDSEKFAGRLRALRKQEKEKISRVAVDEAHFKQFVTNQSNILSKLLRIYPLARIRCPEASASRYSGWKREASCKKTRSMAFAKTVLGRVSFKRLQGLLLPGD